MRNWIVGAGLVVGGSAVVLIMSSLGFTRLVATGTGIAISTFGFVLQMVTAFSMKRRFEKDLKLSQQNHKKIMTKALTLPPEEGIRLLLGNN